MVEYGEAVRHFNEALHAAAAANKEMSAIWKTVEDCPPPWPPPWRGVFEIRDEFLYNYEPCDLANCSRLELHLSQCKLAGFDSEAPE